MSRVANQKTEHEEDWTELSSKPGQAWKQKTLLEYLAGRFRYRSAEGWAEIPAQGLIQVNGLPGKPAQVLAADDQVTTRVRLREPAVPLDFRVVHLDSDLLVA